jgi:hypothetical protein
MEEKIIQYVETYSSFFLITKEGNELSFGTRARSGLYDETFNDEDYRSGLKLKLALQKEFPSAEVSLDTRQTLVIVIVKLNNEE